MSAMPTPLVTVAVGNVSVSYVPDGAIRIRPGDQYPAAPGLWELEADRLDADGFLLMSVGAVLIRSGGKNVLIDSGYGSRQLDISALTGGAREGSIHTGALLDNLAGLGVAPKDIDTICLTHLHGDHTGWIGTREKPTFANARYLLSSREWQYGTSAEFAADAASATAEQISALEGNVRFLEDDPIDVPGVGFISTPGHTPGHTSYVVEDAGERIIVVGDAFHSALELLHPELAFLDDVDPRAAATTKAHLREEFARPDTRFMAGHFTDSVIGRIGDFDRVLSSSLPDAA